MCRRAQATATAWRKAAAGRRRWSPAAAICRRRRRSSSTGSTRDLGRDPVPEATVRDRLALARRAHPREVPCWSCHNLSRDRKGPPMEHRRSTTRLPARSESTSARCAPRSVDVLAGCFRSCLHMSETCTKGIRIKGGRGVKLPLVHRNKILDQYFVNKVIVLSFPFFANTDMTVLGPNRRVSM